MNDHVALRPVDLQVAGGNRRDEHPTVKLAEVIFQLHAVAVGQTEFVGIGTAHQHRVAVRAVDRIPLCIDK